MNGRRCVKFVLHTNFTYHKLFSRVFLNHLNYIKSLLYDPCVDCLPRLRYLLILTLNLMQSVLTNA